MAAVDCESGANQDYWFRLLWFLAKVMIFIFIFIWLREGPCRRHPLRHSSCAFGWKRARCPVSLVWIVAVATIRALQPGSAEHQPRLPVGCARRRARRGLRGAVLPQRPRGRHRGVTQHSATSWRWAGTRSSTPFSERGYPVPPIALTRRPRLRARDGRLGGAWRAHRATGPRSRSDRRGRLRWSSRLGRRSSGLRGDLPAPCSSKVDDRAVPLREGQPHGAEVPRPAPAQPLARRAGEVHRLRAVRVGVPGRRDLRRGRRRTPSRGAVLTR